MFCKSKFVRAKLYYLAFLHYILVIKSYLLHVDGWADVKLLNTVKKARYPGRPRGHWKKSLNSQIIAFNIYNGQKHNRKTDILMNAIHTYYSQNICKHWNKSFIDFLNNKKNMKKMNMNVMLLKFRNIYFLAFSGRFFVLIL